MSDAYEYDPFEYAQALAEGVDLGRSDLQVSSTPGVGSRFWFRLPLGADHTPASHVGAPTKTYLWTGQTQDLILIVDDSTDAAESMALLLTIAGHEVRTANEGATAIKTAFRSKVRQPTSLPGEPKQPHRTRSPRMRIQTIQAVNPKGLWSRPSLPVWWVGILPNSVVQSTSVSASRPRRFRSWSRAAVDWSRMAPCRS